MTAGRGFNVYCPLEAFEKAGDANPMRIGGVVSTDQLDAEGERIIQEGLDFSYFLNRGWFNDNHSKATTGIVGYPTAAKFVRKGAKLPNGKTAATNGWWAEGYLINNEKGRELWGLARALEGTPRSLGFSIEGKVRTRDTRDPKRVTTAGVNNVAITHCPVNFGTELQTLTKALTAGHAVDNPGAAPGEGFALRTESLDRDLADQQWGNDPTTTDEPHDTTTHDGDGEPIGKSDDFSTGPISAESYRASWSAAFAAVDLTPGPMTPAEARRVVQAEHPHLNDAQVGRILNAARSNP